jgi:imidazoleglycerol phosphate dehydratase HisB
MTPVEEALGVDAGERAHRRYGRRDGEQHRGCRRGCRHLAATAELRGTGARNTHSLTCWVPADAGGIAPTAAQVRAEFYSPLDESLQGVTVDFAAPAALSFASPIPTARVGRYATRLMQPFYAALVAEAGMAVDIRRLCDAPNCNSHHIIEATFKAFARAMRAALDVMDARADGPFVVGDVRTAAIHRATGETSIDVEVTLDGHGSHTGTTTIPLLDRQLAELAAASGVSLRVDAVGDTHIDDHHTVEDTAIVIGKALQAALGDRRCDAMRRGRGLRLCQRGRVDLRTLLGMVRPAS